MTPLSIVCWKWKPLRGTISTRKTVPYIAEDVNRLQMMLLKHYHEPFQLICVTDDPTGLSSEIKIVPLWDEFRNKGGCFTRLGAFKRDIGTVFGPRFVSIDLDCVIVGDITPLFDRTEDFIIWGSHGGKTQYCGSLWMMDAGCRPQVYERFDPVNYQIRNGRYGGGGTDQFHISKVLSNEAIWTKLDGIYAYRKLGKDSSLPNEAKLIFFNGPFHPRQEIVHECYPWVTEHYGPAKA